MTSTTNKNILTINAYAKINLYLDVVSRYPDGYHKIESVMQSVSLCDTLYVSEAPYPRLNVECSRAELGGARNLAYRAGEALRLHTGVRAGATINIQKKIPVAAGLAGGSADAAATLFGLNQLWGLYLPEEQLKEIAVQLGADIPFCLTGGTMFAEGKGEVLQPLTPMPDITLVIATPPLHVSTAEVYRAVDDAKPAPLLGKDKILAALRERDVDKIAGSLNNLLENVVLKRYPAISEAKECALASGGVGALMSGSGPSIFVICRDTASAEAVAGALRAYDASFFVETARPVPAGVEMV